MESVLGDRIREFGNLKFQSMKDFASALDMKPPSLQPYLNGVSKPGSEILIKLQNLGCDINWLLSGRESAPNVGTSLFPDDAKHNEIIRQLSEIKQGMEKLNTAFSSIAKDIMLKNK